IMSQLDAYDYKEGESVMNWLREQVNEMNCSVIAEGGWLAESPGCDEQYKKLYRRQSVLK
ncbi:MAG: hypothetical protein FWH00_05520, partial [Oscillospiraceae bacterium]|nr:hypothetical protein [Oscillospiraceae bacterium]